MQQCRLWSDYLDGEHHCTPVVKALTRLSGWVGSSGAYIGHLYDKGQTRTGPYLPSTMYFHPGNLNISIIPFTKFSQAVLKTVRVLISWPQSQTSCKRDFNVGVDQEPMLDLLYTDICGIVINNVTVLRVPCI